MVFNDNDIEIQDKVRFSINKKGSAETEPFGQLTESGRAQSHTATSSENLEEKGEVRLSNYASTQSNLAAKLKDNYYSAKKNVEKFIKAGYKLTKKVTNADNLVMNLASKLGLDRRTGGTTNSYYTDYEIDTISGKYRLSSHPADGNMMSRGNLNERVSVVIYKGGGLRNSKSYASQTMFSRQPNEALDWPLILSVHYLPASWK